MENRLYVNWKKLEDAENMVSGKKYMVAVADSKSVDKEVSYDFATWYNKGDKVSLECPKRAELDPSASAEERLLACIFGGRYDIEVPEDGFYLKTADYGVDGEAGDEGCTEDIIWLGNDIFWSDVPLAPEGYKDSDQVSFERRMRTDEYIKARDQERFEYFKDMLESDEYLSNSFPTLQEKLKYVDTVFPWSDNLGGIYNISIKEIVSALVKARDALRVVEYMLKNKISFKDVFEKVRDDHSYMGTLFDNAGIDSGSRRDLVFLFTYEDSAGFAYYRKVYSEKYDDFNKVLLLSGYKGYLIRRLRRIYKVCEIGAPGVIRYNEFRMFAVVFVSYVTLLKGGSYGINHIAFGEEFGVNIDGTRYIPDESESSDDGDISECDVEIDEDDGVIGVDYPYVAVVNSPNFLFKDGEFALFDNETHDYVKVSGEYFAGSYKECWNLKLDLEKEKN